MPECVTYAPPRIASTLRPLSILLSFSELPVSESDTTFLNLLSMANDRLRSEYGSCLSPETLDAVLDLISALRGIITPDPLCLEIIDAVQGGMQMWIEDEQFVLSEPEFNDGVSPYPALLMRIMILIHIPSLSCSTRTLCKG